MDVGILSMGLTLDSNESHQSKKSVSFLLSFFSILLFMIVSFFLDALRTDGFGMNGRSYHDADKNSSLFHDFFIPPETSKLKEQGASDLNIDLCSGKKQCGLAQETSCVKVAGRDRRAAAVTGSR
jgi:hypothetical protein